MEQTNATPLFETSLSRQDKVFFALQTLLSLAVFIKALSLFTETDWGWPLFLALFAVGLFIQGILIAKTFHLYADRLVVRRPLFFTRKTDRSFPIAEIKELLFKKLKGPYLHIKLKRSEASYQLGFDADTRATFITHLEALGLKVSINNKDLFD